MYIVVLVFFYSILFNFLMAKHDYRKANYLAFDKVSLTPAEHVHVKCVCCCTHYLVNSFRVDVIFYLKSEIEQN